VAEFTGYVAKVLFKTTKESRDKLLGMQNVGSAVTVGVAIKPNPQLAIGEFQAEERPTFGPLPPGALGRQS
jgi:hypothetical protein